MFRTPQSTLRSMPSIKSEMSATICCKSSERANWTRDAYGTPFLLFSTWLAVEGSTKQSEDGTKINQKL
jgi:hypothetical protein